MLLFDSPDATTPQKFLFMQAEPLTEVLKGMGFAFPVVQYRPQSEAVVCSIFQCGEDELYHRVFVYTF